jgi:hypothetical protein
MAGYKVLSSQWAALWAPFATGVLLALPILVVRYPPMGDLAMHEGTVSVMRHLHDPGWVPPGLYFVVAPQANQLFTLAALALSCLLPTSLACKALVAAIVAAVPPLMARILAHVGRSRWLAPLLGPIACGWMFRWGLVANLTGFALLLLALPELERLAKRPGSRAVLRATACAVTVFFAHESSALILAGIATMFALVRSSTWRALLARLAPVGAVVALGVVQWRVSEHLIGANMRAIGSDFGSGPLDRLTSLPGAVFGGMSAGRIALVGSVWVAALVSSAALERGSPAPALPLRIALWRHRYALLTAALLVLYLVFPMALGGTTLLAHRFLPAACACLVVACAAPASQRERATRLLTIALALATPLVMLGVEMRAFLASDTEYRALDALIELIPKNAAVAQLDLTPRAPGRVAPVPGAAGRVLAERGGRMLFAMTDKPPNPLYATRGLAWDEPVERLVATPYAFMPSYDLTRFSFLLERNENSAARSAVARALAPEAELVAESGPWTLFHSRLAVADIAAPDRPLPSPPPETLWARLVQAQSPR